MIDRRKLARILGNQRRKVKAVAPNPAIEAGYRQALLRVVREIHTFNMSFAKRLIDCGLIQYAENLTYEAAFNAKFGKKFEQLAAKYPTEFLGKSDAAHKKAFDKEIKDKIGVDLSKIMRSKSYKVARVVQHLTKENTDLIVSLTGDYKQRAREAIEASMRGELDGTTLRTELEHIEGVTESRAKLIARDQTQKVCSELNAARQQDVGITHYIWRGVDDGRERDSHVENNNQRFAWDDPPPETGHPGEDIQCRCAADPDLSTFMSNLGIGIDTGEEIG